jgi:hypothetical protein
VLDKALRNENPNNMSIKAFQKLLTHMVEERNYSVQETCHLLLQILLYHSSWNFVCLNLNKEANCQLHNRNENNANDEDDKIMKMEPSPLQRYCNRPSKLDELSLFRLYLQYKLVKGNWEKCNNENIVRIWPQPYPIRNGPQWKEFCHVKVLLHPYKKYLYLKYN